MTCDISEYDPERHRIVESIDDVELGDRLGNAFVGECWVTEKFKHEAPAPSFLMVRYQALHCYSKELRDYQRTDPVGPEFFTGKPFFWTLK